VVWELSPSGDSREGKILSGFGRIYAYSFAVAPEILVFHNTVHFGKKSIIAAKSNISARMDLGAELTHQDVTGTDNLTGVPFDPAPLTGTVTTIP